MGPPPSFVSPLAGPPPLASVAAKTAEEERASATEVAEYAEYLGMRPGEDGALLWIAEFALTAPLPEGWQVLEDHLGREFFINKKLGASQYSHPHDSDYAGLLLLMRAALKEPPPTKEEVEAVALWLGIDSGNEPELMWVAQQCAMAPPPLGWRAIPFPV
jgi:hypothetical protein